MDNKRNSNRIEYITFLQAVCAIFVVYLHTNGVFWIYSNERYWASANFIECLFYCAVPLFLMISGATLIDYKKRYSDIEFFKRRAEKVLIPYLFWNFFGMLYCLYWKTIQLNDLTVFNILNHFLNTPYIAIYWFFPTLFGIYLCMPLFASVDDNKRKNLFSYLVVIGIVINVFIPFVVKQMDIDFTLSITVNVVSSFLIYPIGGVLLHFYPPKGKSRIVLYILGVIGFLVHLIGTYSLSTNAGRVITSFKGYTNLPCILYSFACYDLLQCVGNKVMANKNANHFFSWIASYSMSIYLIHYYLLDTERRIIGTDETSLLYRFCAPLIVIPVVIGIVWIIRKVPLLRRIVP